MILTICEHPDCNMWALKRLRNRNKIGATGTVTDTSMSRSNFSTDWNVFHITVTKVCVKKCWITSWSWAREMDSPFAYILYKQVVCLHCMNNPVELYGNSPWYCNSIPSFICYIYFTRCLSTVKAKHLT